MIMGHLFPSDERRKSEMSASNKDLLDVEFSSGSGIEENATTFRLGSVGGILWSVPQNVPRAWQGTNK
jgi:hypothetical protein